MRDLRVARRCLLVCAVVFATGCGTVFSGTNEEVKVTSEPSGADVHVDGQRRGRTPMSTELSSTENHTVEIEKDGYRAEVASVTSRVNGGFIVLDILFAGIVGLAIDAGTGGWKTISPNEIDVHLESESSADDSSDESRDTSGPVSYLQPPDGR